MGCKGCSTSNGKVGGCNSSGCATGGCNRLNTYDWLSDMDIEDVEPFDIVEVSFKNGARKGFYRQHEFVRTVTGDWVVVETGTGFDIGKISLSGDLVRLQMKKKRVNEESVIYSILRRANERDLERLQEGREIEMQTMVRARAISRTLGLDMKIGDVEFQGDLRKATFFYTADGRVDFRELIRHFAREFRVKVEMRQIGARQESARIGGIGSCGRELCCSTWLSDFKSVSTSAARYQNLAINQAKLSGQCGRLKCCLNYELDTYLDALENFPEQVERLETQAGRAVLIKTDIFKGLLYYIMEKDRGRGKIYALNLDQVKEFKALNDKGEKPADLGPTVAMLAVMGDEDAEMDFGDVTGAVELPDEKRKKRKKKRNKGKSNRTTNQQASTQNRNNTKEPRNQANAKEKPTPPKDKTGGEQKPKPSRGSRNKNRRNRDNRKKE